MEVTINYNGQAVAVEVTLEVYEFLDRADHKTENLFHEQRRHWDGREFDEYIITTEGVGAYGETPEDILLEREEMTTRLHLIAALPAALAHATPTQARRVHAYYIAGIKQPEISRIEGVHSSKVSGAIRRGLRNMRRCYDDLFQTE